MEQTQSMSPKIFLNKVLAGTATGIIIGLIPNAVLGAILRYFSGSSFAMAVAQMAVIFQLATPLIIGGLIALQFGFAPMKMMMPNLFRRPVILVPCLISAVITAIPVALLSISGTPASAGFGIVGLVGPLASLDAGLNPALVVLSWLVVPVAAALFTQFLCEKVLKLYDRADVFEFLG